MDRMDDDKFKSLWGEELFSYAYAKSQELIGYPDYPVMMVCAIGKLHEDTDKLLKLSVKSPAVGG